MPRSSRWPSRLLSIFVLILSVAIGTTPSVSAADQAKSLELTRPVRIWEFLPVVGTRAGLFGNEAGNFEAWVYPLKILRNFHLNVLVDHHLMPAETLARTLTVHPESATILYAGDTWQVRETLFVPVHQAGAIITLEVDTREPIEIEADFERDFQLEWPAGLGATYMNWDPALKAFSMGEETKKFVALVGSPNAQDYKMEYATNSSMSRVNTLDLGTVSNGTATKTIVIAASVEGREPAMAAYRKLASDSAALLADSAEYYRSYLDRTVNLELPDSQLQTAYDWSRISTVQGLVTNPYMGTGLVAGYRTSGDTQRPGFAWYFGRDSFWTSLALNAEADFATTKTALEFISKYQRENGKIPHEIAQGASFVNWFKDYPYGAASADATPLYIIAVNDYVKQSGDVAFASEKWDSLWKAYQFLRSTYDAQGFPQNFGFGHGWIEGGPLVPVKTELYQSGVGLEALRALSNLAHVTGKEDVSKQLAEEFSRRQPLLNQTFWSPGQKIYAYALDKDSKRLDIPSVLATVPMWFGVLDADKSEQMIDKLAAPDHQADWGMRIISDKDSHYNPGGYHFGSVWPLFTGWAAVGEYRYHRALPAYSNLRANFLLALDGSLGHVTEVLSGDYYQSLSTASPHQIWSAAMVVSPILRGMLGLESDALTRRLTFTPHLPADWTHVAIRNLKIGNAALDIAYRKTVDGITLQVQKSGAGDCTLDFSPAFSLRAQVLGADFNGHPAPVQKDANSEDQHAAVHLTLKDGANTLHIRSRNDFGIGIESELPPLGTTSRGLRIVSQSWSADRSRLTLSVAGVAGNEYTLPVWNAAQVVSVDGGAIEQPASAAVSMAGPQALLRIKFPPETGSSYTESTVVLHFAGSGAQK